jgi:hypothetical protein
MSGLQNCPIAAAREERGRLLCEIAFNGWSFAQLPNRWASPLALLLMTNKFMVNDESPIFSGCYSTNILNFEAKNCTQQMSWRNIVIWSTIQIIIIQQAFKG